MVNLINIIGVKNFFIDAPDWHEGQKSSMYLNPFAH